MSYRKENLKFWIMTIIFSFSVTTISCFGHYVNENQDSDSFRIFNSLIFYNASPSIPRGVYIRIPMLWIKNGDYVVYHPNKEATDIAFERSWIKSKHITFIKRVRGIQGDIYSIDINTGFYINGKYYGQISVCDGTGKAMPIHSGVHYVSQNEFLPVGESSMSFDGRYTGTVPLENIKAKVIPLFTEAMLP